MQINFAHNSERITKIDANLTKLSQKQLGFSVVGMLVIAEVDLTR